MPRSPEQNQIVKDRRKAKLLDNALKVFAIKGYSNTSIDSITKAARCSHGLFYHYFDSKEEAEEWAEEEYRAGQIYADYSPTGRWFISDIRVAHIEGNRWRVMICESLDC